MRYGSDQVQGRHPYLVTRAPCCGVPFTPKSRKIKVSEAITSAGILWVLRRRSPHLRILRLRSPSLGCLGRVAGPRTVGAYHSGFCSDAVQEKRRCSPTDFYSVGAERGRAWTELRCAWSYLPSQGRGCKHQSCAANPSDYSALVAYAVALPGRLGVLDVDVFAVLCSLHFGLWTFSPLAGVSPCSSCWSLLSLFRVVLVALFVFFSWLSRWFRGRSGWAPVCLSRLRVLRSWYFVCGLPDFGIFPISTWFAYFLPFVWHFPVSRGAHQVGRFAACSF